MADINISPVCDLCQNICEENSSRVHILGGDRIYVHYPNLALLVASADGGCSVCQVLLYAFEFDGWWGKASKRRTAILARIRKQRASLLEDAAELGNEDDARRIAQLLDSARASGKELTAEDPVLPRTFGDGRVILSISSFSLSNQQTSIKRLPAVMTRADADLRIKVIGRETIEGAGWVFLKFSPSLHPEPRQRPCKKLLSAAHVALIQRWMRKCSAEHTKCRSSQVHVLPTRVIKIPPSSAGRLRSVKLVETRDAARGQYTLGQYACLSYCWGETTAEMGITTKENYSGHLEEILLERLPKTIADAIELCQAIGLRYLWVDRLCIIQGDHGDWEHEASKMSEIYSRSLLTIATPICNDASQSFLDQRRKRRWHPGREARIYHDGGPSGMQGSLVLWSGVEAFPRQSCFTLHGRDWALFADDMRSPKKEWLERAWTLQEWMLSPRLLHVHKVTVWDCFEGYADEIRDRHMGPSYLGREASSFASSFSWMDIVSEFTDRSITRPEDRLPALAGLAARQAEATRRTYLTGLWLEEMPSCLLWHRGRDALVRAPHLYAPSWSWASLSGHVRMPWNSAVAKERARARASVSAPHITQADSNDIFPNTPWISIEGPLSLVAGQKVRYRQTDSPDVLIRVFRATDGPHDTDWEAYLDEEPGNNGGGACVDGASSGAGWQGLIDDCRVYLSLIQTREGILGRQNYDAVVLVRCDGCAPERGEDAEHYLRAGYAQARDCQGGTPGGTACVGWGQRKLRLQ